MSSLLTTRVIIHRLLRNALLELRMHGHASGDKTVFHLADLFHNVPGMLANAAQDDYESILSFLKQRASEIGCKAWIDQQIAQFEQIARREATAD